MEDGRYTLAMLSELLQELLEDGDISGAASVVRKLHEAAEVTFKPVEEDIPDVDCGLRFRHKRCIRGTGRISALQRHLAVQIPLYNTNILSFCPIIFCSYRIIYLLPDIRL